MAASVQSREVAAKLASLIDAVIKRRAWVGEDYQLAEAIDALLQEHTKTILKALEKRK